MKTPKLHLKVPRTKRLTHAQWLWLAIGCGSHECPKPFATEDEAREAWQIHRGKVEPTNPGTRARGWWAFESPEPRDRSIPEREQLARIGALRPNE
jgi:hypothetical protein